MNDPRVPAPEDLVEHAPCGLLVTGTDGSILRANTTFCAWTGYGAHELVGAQRLQDLFTMGGRLFHQTHWAPLLQMQGSIAEVKLEVIGKNGASIPMILNAVRRPTHDEVATFMAKDRHMYERELLNARTQLHEAYQQLAEADRRKDEFLAMLAHELRNPLAPMQNVAQIMSMKELDDPQLLWGREVLERQVEHMTHLVDDLLDVSRITQGKLQLRREVMDLNTAVSAAAETSRALVRDARHELQLDLPGRPLFVEADATRVTQIVQNLLNNAVKYTPSGGTICLRAEEDDGHARVTVRDSGIGIPPEQIARVFDMFAQLEPALERSQGGLGIGLALVKALVKLHGGTIEAHSDGAGRGSTFSVRIPLCAAPAPVVREQPATSNEAQRRILLVDDNADSLATMAILLEMRGHTVCTAANGTEGLAMLECFTPDLVVLDIGLPDISGYDVARRMREHVGGRDVVLVALSGWGQERDRQHAYAAGFDTHLTKPVDRAGLERLLSIRRS